MIKMDHIGLVVKDFDKQLSFYRDVIGLKVTKDWVAVAPPGGSHTGMDSARRRLAFLADDEGVLLELIYYIDPVSPVDAPIDHHHVGSAHLCFLTDNIEQRYEDLLQRGIKFLTPPKMTNSGNCLCYGQDPEGNWIELKEKMEDGTKK